MSLSIGIVRFWEKSWFGHLENQSPNLGQKLFLNTQVIWNKRRMLIKVIIARFMCNVF
jgi:hypothetical protein